MTVMQFKPIRIEHGSRTAILRPYETWEDLAFLINAGIEKSKCVQVEKLVPLKLRDLAEVDAEVSCTVFLGEGQVDWDGTLTRVIPDSELIQIDWKSSIKPGDRIVFRKPQQLLPNWDEDRRELRFGDIVIKKFRKNSARNQVAVLRTFQEDGWPEKIDDPLHGPTFDSRKRLADTIDGLKENHLTPNVLTFRGDGTGEGVLWEQVGDGKSQ